MDETIYIPADATPQRPPEGWTQNHLAVDALGALLVPAPGRSLPVDVVVAQVQDYVWAWYRVLLSRDLVLSGLRACRADLEVRAGAAVNVLGVRMFGPVLEDDARR